MMLAYPELGTHLATGELRPAYVLTGEQDLLREQARKEIQAAAVGEVDTGFNLDRFDGESASIDQVLLACNMLPMMGARRAVIVQRALGYVEEGRGRSTGKGKGTAAETLIEYLKDPSPKTVLVLELEKSPDGRRKAWREIQKQVAVVRCDPLRDGEIEGWLAAEAKRRELRLGRAELRYLAVEFGTDLRRQLNELEKIALYATGRKIDVGELAEVLGRGKAQSIFRFTDAVADRDAAPALKQLGRLLREGEPPLRILALLDRTLGQLLVAREMGRGAGRGGELARTLGVPPRVADEIARRAATFEEHELIRAMAGLAACDRMLKTSGTPARLVLEGLVISLCDTRRRTVDGGQARTSLRGSTR